MDPKETYQPTKELPKSPHQELQDDLGMYVPPTWTVNVPDKTAEAIKKVMPYGN